MGKKIQLQGGGRAVKSYIHIRDVADATLKIARNGINGEIYHISPEGDGISIIKLVSSIASKLGKKLEIKEKKKKKNGKNIITKERALLKRFFQINLKKFLKLKKIMLLKI